MAVCGIKRNFEDLSPSPLACKRVRYSCSTSPINNQIPHNNSSTAIKNPHELSSESAEEKPAEIDLSAPTNGVEWTHSLIKKLMAAKSVEDAMVCTTGVLGDFERSIGARIEAHLNQEIMSLKEQAERLTEENTMLKRAVVIQHERQKEYENKDGELQHVKDVVVPQLREKLRTMEVNNYALSMHLKQALQKSPFPGNFHSYAF
ncbi:hypothetical protein FH972_027244 [Carpinus fangiana]|uniref:Uncharacterized protein n=1 Tax=Carpinus fangiana TaxID=176857 RepID=A0A5N6L6H4_9ROSI|nr:hypothetical protein FH972_027244 [Carpinus fangiana]